jgi:Ca2+-binding EF-hand superfamily protein
MATINTTVDPISEPARFEMQLKEFFKKHDPKKRRYLVKEEVRGFIDEIRTAIHLEISDSRVSSKVWVLLSKGDCPHITFQIIMERMIDLVPLFLMPSEKMEKMLTQTFNDFDVDESGFLERSELKLLLNLASDQLARERCPAWQIEYLVGLLDGDRNGKIDLGELLENFYLINQAIAQNPGIDYSKTKGKGGKKLFQVQNSSVQAKPDNPITTLLTNVCRMIMKLRNDKMILNEKNRGIKEVNIDQLNHQSIKSSSEFMPLPQIINSDCFSNPKMYEILKTQTTRGGMFKTKIAKHSTFNMNISKNYNKREESDGSAEIQDCDGEGSPEERMSHDFGNYQAIEDKIQNIEKELDSGFKVGDLGSLGTGDKSIRSIAGEVLVRASNRNILTKDTY